jgi:hypothetical protein
VKVVLQCYVMRVSASMAMQSIERDAFYELECVRCNFLCKCAAKEHKMNHDEVTVHG